MHMCMSLSDAFGPPKPNDVARHERSNAISWVRSSLFSRMAKSKVLRPHRSDVAVAVMYAAELYGGDYLPAKRVKLEEARARLERLTVSELNAILDVAGPARDAAMTPGAREWGGRVVETLRDILAGKAGQAREVREQSAPARQFEPGAVVRARCLVNDDELSMTVGKVTEMKYSTFLELETAGKYEMCAPPLRVVPAIQDDEGVHLIELRTGEVRWIVSDAEATTLINSGLWEMASVAAIKASAVE